MICSNENRLVSPTAATDDMRRLASCLTFMTRLAISPVLYCLKKLAGRENSRIIPAASTDTDTFVSIRTVRSCFTVLNSWELTLTSSIKLTSAASATTLPLAATWENSRLLSRGSSSPTRLTASADRAKRMRSAQDVQEPMYFIMPGMPIFPWGKGL